MKIRSMTELEEAAVKYGILPFFPNNIRGFSVEEMTPAGLLFGGNEYEGCWEWKGPVIRNRTTAYGKFFRRKAGFVSRELLPYFLKFRSSRYGVTPGSTDEMIYDIISINDRMTSTELREILVGKQRRRTAEDLPDLPDSALEQGGGRRKQSRHAIEGPLQRLQMGGRICISDFRYKLTRNGDRYGWGVAEYSAPESIFDPETLHTDLSPEECLDYIKEFVCSRYPGASPQALSALLS